MHLGALLTPSERARFTQRRKEAYEALHPETRAGVAQAAGMNSAQGRGRNVCDDVARFSAETAAATGRSERAVQLDAERGARVIPEAMDMIRGTKLDTGAYLDRIKWQIMPLDPSPTRHRPRRALG